MAALIWVKLQQFYKSYLGWCLPAIKALNYSISLSTSSRIKKVSQMLPNDIVS